MGVEIFVYLPVDGVLSRSCDVHQDEYHKVDERHFALDDACPVDVKESYAHCYQHGNHT